MPSLTPASFGYTGGSFRSTRPSPARLGFAPGSFLTSKDTPISTPAVAPDLDRLVRSLDKADGETDQQFQRRQIIWQQTMEAIEGAFAAVNARVDEVALYARLAAVEAKAEAANDNATAAKANIENITVAAQQTFTDIAPNYGDSFDERVNLQ